MGRSLLTVISVLCFVIIVPGQTTNKSRALPQILNLTVPVSEKDLDRAIQDYNVTIVFNPSSSDAYFNRGCLKQSKGDLDGALRDYNRTIDLKHKHAAAFNNRATVYHALGNLDLARADYDS